MFSPVTSLALLLSVASPAPSTPSPSQEQAPATATAEAPPSDEVQVPRRLDSVAVPYPEAEQAAGREGEVVLRLTLDEQGSVTDSEVVRSAGAAFDEAVRTASLSFKFEPARVRGEAVACQIELAHTFKLDAPPPPVP
ncbi:energy transducer TonB, partial [Myxococcus sp. CA039A]